MLAQQRPTLHHFSQQQQQPMSAPAQPYYKQHGKHLKVKTATVMYSDALSTQANTPDCSESEEIHSEGFLGGHFHTNTTSVPFSCQSFSGYESPDSPLNFEIDVKPKKKMFHTQEEKQRFVQDYSRKLKTEMCKNWETTGQCKFGDRCSFAHGSHELKGKSHLHSNYKTKPCKKYFLKGYCSYGHRCQYLHRELLRRPEFRDFALKVYAEKKLALPPLQETRPGVLMSEDEAALVRFNLLREKVTKTEWFLEATKEKKEAKKSGSSDKGRLTVFENIAPKDSSPFLLDLSRPMSLNAFTEEQDFFCFERSE